MGYTIKIGNATPQFDKECFPELWAQWKVELVEHPDAPSFGEPTDRENQRWPSYTGWEYFLDGTDLKDWWEKVGNSHPGIYGLTLEDRILITEKLNTYTKTEEEDWNYNRLVWLEYWVRWAVENCETPAIENS